MTLLTDYSLNSIQASQEAIVELSKLIADKGLTPTAWMNLMREELKFEYIRQYLLGVGGLTEMTQSDWGKLGAMLKEQYKYLNGFRDDLASGNYTPEQIQGRAGMYINSSKEAFEKAQEKVMSDAGAEEELWVLGDVKTEHCPDCLEFADQGWQPVGTFPMPGEGKTRCLTACGCHKEYRNANGDVMVSEVAERVMRGGPGSGFFNHEGRKGLVGGSVGVGSPNFQYSVRPLVNDSVYYSIVDETTATREDGNFWIMPGGQVLKCLNGHEYAAQDLISDKKGGSVTGKQAEAALFDHGAVRIESTNVQVGIQTRNFDTTSLHRIQDLMLSQKIYVPPSVQYIHWDGGYHSGSYTPEEFYNASEVVGTILRVTRIGTSSSGSWGHAGRKGLVGGSLPGESGNRYSRIAKTGGKNKTWDGAPQSNMDNALSAVKEIPSKYTKDLAVEFIHPDANRSFYLEGDTRGLYVPHNKLILVYADSGASETFAHEIGHYIFSTVPDIQTSFYKSLAKDPIPAAFPSQLGSERGSEWFAWNFSHAVLQGTSDNKYITGLVNSWSSVQRIGTSSSGNWGHAGRPGAIGGSAPSGGVSDQSMNTYERSSWDDLSSGHNSLPITNTTAGIITPDNKLLDTMGDDHMEFMDLHRKMFGLPTMKNVTKFTNSEVVREDLNQELLKRGYIRARVVFGRLQLQSESIDTPTMKRLQKLTDKGLLPNMNGSLWMSKFGSADTMDFDSNDLLSSRFVSKLDGGEYIFRSGWLKRLVVRYGTSSSGSWGHAGRKGLVGGQAAGSSGGNAAVKSLGIKSIKIRELPAGYYAIGQRRPPTEQEKADFTTVIMSLPEPVKALWVGWGGNTEYSKREEVPEVILSMKDNSGDGESRGDQIFLDPEYLKFISTGGGGIAAHEFIHILCNQPTFDSFLQSLYNPAHYFIHAQNAQDQRGEDMTMMLTELWDIRNQIVPGQDFTQAWTTEVSKMMEIWSMSSGDKKSTSTMDLASEKVGEVTTFLKGIGLW